MEKYQRKIYEVIEPYFIKYNSLSNSEIAEIMIREEGDLGMRIDSLIRRISEYRNLTKDFVDGGTKIARQLQKQRDINRIERKVFRENSRIHNAMEEMNQQLIKLLSRHSLTNHVTYHEEHQNNQTSAGVLQISDPHFNELVELKDNRYDFDIASKRMKLFVEEAITAFQKKNVGSVLVAITGDLINSDRRLDEKLNMATNRTKAVFLATELLSQVLLHLNQYFNVTVACVSGNESRVGEVVEWSDMVLTDNYDFMIFNMLKYLFATKEDQSGISFIHGDPAEIVVNVGGKNFLLLHGNQSFKHDQEGVQKVLGKYMDEGIVVDYAIFGHIHSAYISDIFGRGGSLVGSNAYSKRGLQLSSKASQNIYIVQNGRIHATKVDLQNVDGVTGYDLTKLSDMYNPKSASLNRQPYVIYEITI